MTLRISPYTYHWSRSPEHKDVYLIGLDVPLDSKPGSFVGVSGFSNSFGQPSVYAYYGRKYERPFQWDNVYWSWSAGVIYGYRPPYNHKVPLNYKGFSPGVVPSLGYHLNSRWSAEVELLGNAGFMLSVTAKLN